MPLIDIQVLENVFSSDEKAEIISRVTEAFASVAGGRMHDATSVRIHEIRSGDWGFAGKPMTTADAIRMRRGEPSR